MTEKNNFLALEGVKLYYETIGEGFPIVFIHGLSVDCRMWNPQIEYFAKDYQVIRYDVRGFGKSVFEGDAHAHIAADDLRDLLDHLEIKKAHIVGLSMGGNIALSFAATYPERVEKLVSADADVQGFTEYTPEFRQVLGDVFKIGASAGGLKAKLAWAKNPLLQPTVQNEHTKIIETMIRDYSGAHLTNPKFLPTSKLPTAQILDKIKANTLVVVGEKDITDFQRMADFIHQSIAHSQKEIIKNAGHMPNLEKPEAFNEVLGRFLKD
jgi:pimeloyl-ACP methyl ester carboxylesterase